MRLLELKFVKGLSLVWAFSGSGGCFQQLCLLGPAVPSALLLLMNLSQFFCLFIYFFFFLLVSDLLCNLFSCEAWSEPFQAGSCYLIYFFLFFLKYLCVSVWVVSTELSSSSVIFFFPSSAAVCLVRTPANSFFISGALYFISRIFFECFEFCLFFHDKHFSSRVYNRLVIDI